MKKIIIRNCRNCPNNSLQARYDEYHEDDDLPVETWCLETTSDTTQYTDEESLFKNSFPEDCPLEDV
jgi:hypothetical protein